MALIAARTARAAWGRVTCRVAMATALVAGAPVASYASDAVDTHVWAAGVVTADLSPGPRGLSLAFDAHMRRNDPGTTWLVRPALGVRLGTLASVWAGYVAVPTLRDDDAELVVEHRAWQQLVAQHRVAGVALQSRTRLEQRLRDDGDDVGLRLRQMVRVGYELDTPSTLGVVVWDELFVHLNDTDFGAQAGLDQNRVFAGLSVRASDRARVELGYLGVWVARPARDLFSHGISATVFGTFKRDHMGRAPEAPAPEEPADR